MRRLFRAVVFPVFALLLLACRDTAGSDKLHLSLTALDSLRCEDYVISRAEIDDYIAHMSRKDNGNLSSDIFVKNYYSSGQPLLWVSYEGLSQNVDSLLGALSAVDSLGFSRLPFRIAQIEDDISRFRNLDFNNDKSTINKVIARIEYNMTRAMMRFARGQRYGFTSPARLNRIDTLSHDSVRVSYRRLFDIQTEQPTDSFFLSVIAASKTDSLTAFLRHLSPSTSLYKQLFAELQRAQLPSYRNQLIVNMEKCRWRSKTPMVETGKRVVVNIPSCLLYAYGEGDTTMVMRVGCGSMKTKTPILNSKIHRMDINPQWVIPPSIVKKEIAHHAGNRDYFARHRYFICRRPSFQRVNIGEVSSEMLRSGNYAVVQEGGEGNALGRIIFRFANNLSVYLHDTSSRGVFSRDDRRVSHGCIRLQFPFRLVKFLLGNDDEDLLGRIEYSMTTNIKPHKKDSVWVSPQVDKSRLVSMAKVEPSVPLSITYFTIYPDQFGYLQTYSDIYGYDKIILGGLKNYL